MKTIIGSYGRLAESLINKESGSLSYRNLKYTALDIWKKKASLQVLKFLAPSETVKSGTVKGVCKNKYKG